ncbi:hypothetical protein ID866_6639 [Astraeus odoratus]|nr:hypothetical protein ID866_6639 [Astraeus odoratus]
MKTTFATFALFVAGALAQQLTINTPSNVVECEPTLLSWTGGTAPYYLALFIHTRNSILPGATPNGAAIENLGQQNSTSVTWVCNIASGTSIGLTLRDSTGLTAQSAAFTVNSGSSTSCLNTTSIAAGPTVSSGSGTTAAATGTSTSPGSSNTATSSASGSTASSSSQASSGAIPNGANFGAAGAIGAVVAALFL